MWVRGGRGVEAQAFNPSAQEPRIWVRPAGLSNTVSSRVSRAPLSPKPKQRTEKTIHAGMWGCASVGTACPVCIKPWAPSPAPHSHAQVPSSRPGLATTAAAATTTKSCHLINATLKMSGKLLTVNYTKCLFSQKQKWSQRD